MHVQSLEASQSPPILKGCIIHMHTTHKNLLHKSVTQIKQTTTIKPEHCGASRQQRMFEKGIYNYENEDKLRRTVPPTHHRTTVRAKVDGATYSTKAQLSSASLEKRCGSRHLQFAYLSGSSFAKAVGFSGKAAVNPSSANSGSNRQ